MKSADKMDRHKNTADFIFQIFQKELILNTFKDNKGWRQGLCFSQFFMVSVTTDHVMALRGVLCYRPNSPQGMNELNFK